MLKEKIFEHIKYWFLCGKVANEFDIVLSEFEIKLWYYVYFRINILGKWMNILFHPVVG